jgi:hypothetical protein
MAIELSTTFPGTFNTDLYTKEFEVGEIWFDPKVAFKRSQSCHQVHQPVVKVHSMKQRSRPKLRGKALHVKQRPNLHSKVPIIELDNPILRRTVGTSRLYDIVEGT